MKRFIMAAAITAAVTMLPNPAPADAAAGKPCLQEAVDSCSDEFPGSDPYSAAVRGWCYIIRSAICAALE